MAITAREFATAFDIPTLTTFCKSAREETPLPLSSVAEIAFSISVKLSFVAPLIPRRAKSSADSAGDGVPPAARTLMRFTMLAR